MRDRRISLVKRVAFSNKQRGSFLIKCRRVRWWRLDIRVEYQLVGWSCPSSSKNCETRPFGLRQRATLFLCRKSLVCNLIVKGRLFSWSPILQRGISLQGGTLGVTLQSRLGIRCNVPKIAFSFYYFTL